MLIDLRAMDIWIHESAPPLAGASFEIQYYHNLQEL